MYNDVEVNMRTLQEYYEMGIFVGKRPKKLSITQRKLLEKFERLNKETRYKVRSFAARYTENELMSLLDRCRKHDFPMGFSLIIRLLAVPKEHRREAERLTVKNKWSRSKLDLWIQQVVGKPRKRGGRPPGNYHSSEELLSGLRKSCLSWIRQQKSLTDENAKYLDKLTGIIKQRYAEATKKIVALHELVQASIVRIADNRRNGDKAPT